MPGLAGLRDGRIRTDFWESGVLAKDAVCDRVVARSGVPTAAPPTGFRSAVRGISGDGSQRGMQRAEENAEDDCAQRIVLMQKKRHESVSKAAAVPVVNIV